MLTSWNQFKEFCRKYKWITTTGGIFMLLCGRFVINKMYRKINQLPPGPDGILPFFGYSLNTILFDNWHLACPFVCQIMCS